MYRARDVRLRRDVALKVIAALERGRGAPPSAQRGTRRRCGKPPEHCQIFEIGEEQDTLFITMELLTGETLADRILRGPTRHRPGDSAGR